ncbi:MAG: polysaccharide biosynthesis/export family protein [Bacteroidaceae bacterium]|nr:polysaccharide biosynthesis/export family protein [Bacteroidaceae bacterium]
MKNIVNLFFIATVALLFVSCASRNVAYFKNSNSVSLDTSPYLYDAKIMPKDVLSITVSTSDDAAAVPFNLTIPTPYTLGQRNSYSQAMLQSYIVDNDGNIKFPLVGTLHLAGLTKNAAEQLIHDKIKPYMTEAENPIVTVRMINYKISVMGEVARPGMFTVANEKITILEALAQAGDLTIYGRRDRVKLIREDATGEKEIHVLNLNDANIINSPYFYLQQNDVVYVEPNKVKAQNSSIGPITTLAVSVTGVLVSITTLIFSLTKK